MRILIIEPNKTDREIIKTVLQRFESYNEIEFADTAYNASIKLHEQYYNLIIAEIFLPDLRADIMINFLSNKGYTIGLTNFIASDSIRKSFDDVLLKPLIDNELERTLMNAHLHNLTSPIFCI